MSGELELTQNGPEGKDTPELKPPDYDVGRSSPPKEPPWTAALVLTFAALFLYLVRGILAPFVIAGTLAYVFSPIVQWIEKHARVPRVVGVALVFVLLLGPIGALLWFVEPRLVAESQELGTDAPQILNRVLYQLVGAESAQFLGITFDANSVTAYLLATMRDIFGSPTSAFRVAARAVETALNIFLSLVLLFYFLSDPKPFGRVLLRLIPPSRRPSWQDTAAEIHYVMGRYVRGLFFLVALMSMVNWAGLALIFHLPYALPIAIAGGFLEIIPFLGPVLAAAIAVIVGLSQGGVNTAAGLILFYLMVREAEDQIVMPLVLGHAVRLHPAMNIFAVLAGGAIAGVLGALLGIPVAAALKVAFDRWRPA